MLCLFCKASLKENDNFFIDSSTTSRGSILLDVLDKIVETKVKYLAASLCAACCSVLDEFDVADETCNQIRLKVTEYLRVPDKQLICTKIACSQTQQFDESQHIAEDEKINNKDEIINFLQVEIEEQYVKNTCTTCSKTFNNLTEYKKHCNVHKKAKSFDCDICGKAFRSKQGASVHKSKQHLETSCVTNCDVDIVNVPIVSSEQTTIKQESINNDEICSEASKKPEISKKTRGKKRRVAGSASYQCPECPKKWKTPGELKSHMSSHSQIRPYICEVCGQAYKQKTALDVHVGMHNGINPFSCPYCNKAFTQKGALQRHIPIHTGEAPYQCDLCGKRFVHHTSFNMHQLTHTGQKDYKCTICGLALLSGSHLKRHMRVHTGERPYACTQCGKRFAERYNLMAHQRLHEAGNSAREVKRNHRCQICGQSFERRMKLEEHLSNEHHKIGDADETKEWMGSFLAGAEAFWHQKNNLIKNESIHKVEVEYHS